MKPLLLLLSIFAVGLMLKKGFKINKISERWIGLLAMSCMLLFTGVSHFIFLHGMAAMLPAWFPSRINIILVTGVLEIIGGLALLIPGWSRMAGILLILFLIGILPANVYAAVEYIDPVSGTQTGPGPGYLFFRIPLQLFFISWIYITAIARKPIKI